MNTSTTPAIFTSVKLACLLPLAFALTVATAEEAENPDETTENPENSAESTETGAATDQSPADNSSTEEVDEAKTDEEKEWERLGRGIRYRDLNLGDGESPGLWAKVYVHYRIYSEYGLLLENTFARGSPEKFVIGSGLMPVPLEMAVKSMKERGKRELMVPAEMFEPEDFRHHSEAHGGNLDQVKAALRPGMLLRAELSLMWVRPYDPAERHRFQ